MKLQVTYAQFLSVFAAVKSAQTVVFYVLDQDGHVVYVMVRDPKLGGTAIELIGSVFPLLSAFLTDTGMTQSAAVQVTSILS